MFASSPALIELRILPDQLVVLLGRRTPGACGNTTRRCRVPAGSARSSSPAPGQDIACTSAVIQLARIHRLRIVAASTRAYCVTRSSARWRSPGSTRSAGHPSGHSVYANRPRRHLDGEEQRRLPVALRIELARAGNQEGQTRRRARADLRSHRVVSSCGRPRAGGRSEQLLPRQAGRPADCPSGDRLPSFGTMLARHARLEEDTKRRSQTASMLFIVRLIRDRSIVAPLLRQSKSKPNSTPK